MPGTMRTAPAGSAERFTILRVTAYDQGYTFRLVYSDTGIQSMRDVHKKVIKKVARYLNDDDARPFTARLFSIFLSGRTPSVGWAE